MSKVLNFLKEEKDARIKTIARKLQMEEGTVEMILEELIHMGYIERVIPQDFPEDNCSPTKCKNCYKKDSCKPLLKISYRILK
jgi:hypothetical protein